MSDSGPLKQLTIEHLRGSVSQFSLQFDKGKKLTVIYGENGTGKSTICDAFEFLGKGKVGSLENRGLGKTKGYWHSIGKNASDVSVSLETTSTKCKATIGKTDVIVTPIDSRPNVEVLRRSQILSLVAATAGDRYNEIRRFIDVSGVEASEATLRQLIKDLNGQREIAIARVQENEDSIRQFWDAEGKPPIDPLEWAKGEASKDTSTFDSEIMAIGKLDVAYNRLTDLPEQIKNAEIIVTGAIESLAAAQKKADEAVQSISQDAGEVVAVLQAAKAYLIKNPFPSVCPLCESTENTENLANRISQRIASFSSVHSAQIQTTSFEQALQRAENSLQTVRNNAKQYAAAFEKCRLEHKWPSDVLLPATPIPDNPSALNAWLIDNGHLPTEWKKVEASRRDKKSFLIALEMALRTLQENTLSLVEIDSLLPRLSKALEILEEERRSFTDVVLATIADEVGRLTGRVKCIYIDPPYNTGNAFEHYDDAVEHSIWLSLMRDRLIVLKKLLSDDGFICCHIDDSEGHYLKVLLDEIFERSNYLTTLYVQVRYPEKTLKQDMDFHKEIEQIHIYRKKYGAKPKLNEKQGSFEKFNFYIEELKPGKETVLGGKRAVIFNKGDYRITQSEGSAIGLKEIWATGTILDGNSSGRFFRDYLTGRVEQDGLGVLYKIYGIGDDSFDYRYFTGPQRVGATKGKYFQGVPRSQLENPEETQTAPIENFYDLAGSFGNCRTEGSADFRGGKKPEALIQLILKHFSIH